MIGATHQPGDAWRAILATGVITEADIAASAETVIDPQDFDLDFPSTAVDS